MATDVVPVTAPDMDTAARLQRTPVNGRAASLRWITAQVTGADTTPGAAS